jgi:transcriptional regulator with XRE-family HTH domain
VDAPLIAFGDLVAQQRTQLGWSQQELATKLGVKQQTVSRWEKGLAKPRAREIPSIAKILRVEEQKLHVAAGHEASGETRPVDAPTFDQTLPVYALSPESFERFCTDFLDRHYREEGGRAARYGGPGHKQQGIDIVVESPNGTYAFQCKRVDEFGEQKVHTAVATQTFQADLSVLLLSNIASPKARDAMAKHKNWQLWDREDISRKFRELPMVDRKDLVDIYFPGQRLPLLGESEEGPLISAETFFKPLLNRDSFFSQDWKLVGREGDLSTLEGHLLNHSVTATLMVGAPGAGKTRLLRDLLERLSKKQPELLVRFVSPTEDVRAHQLAQLGRAAKLLVVDDAHDREDIGQLLRFAADSDNKARLLLALRPYGQQAMEMEAAKVGLHASEVSIVPLNLLGRDDARTLASEVLKQFDGPLEAAEDIAAATHGAPLVTVLAAQIVAKQKISPALLVNVPDFQRNVLSRLQDVLTGRIVSGADVPKFEAVLRTVALLQPVVPDEPVLLTILQEVEGVGPDDSKRLMRLLTEAGVLFKRGLRYRLAPDLLADSIIQTKLLNEDGTASDKVSAIFARADTQYLKHLLVNLGRLEWRMRGGMTEGSKVLSSLVPQLKWFDDYRNAHIEAVQAVAFYQPKLAIDFASKLIDEQHGQHQGVGGMLKYAAYNFTYLEDACRLLWKAGSNDPRPLHQHPYHGVRVLKELAQFEPRKPIAYVEKVVDFALALLQRPRALTGAYTPFAVLEGALGTEMEERHSSSRSLTITRYQIDVTKAKGVRQRVVAELLRSIEKGPPRRGYLAASSLAQALRSPMQGSAEGWNEMHDELLSQALTVLSRPDIHPAVLMRAASSVSWHAGYGSEPSKSKARAIVDLLDTTLERRLTRALSDGWGTETWKIGAPKRREAHELHAEKVVRDLARKYPEPSALFDFVNASLSQLREIAPASTGAAGVFVSRLLENVSGFAEEVFTRRDETAPLNAYVGAALAVLLGRKDGGDWAMEEMLRSSDPVAALRLLADAYARQQTLTLDESDLAVIKSIFESNDPQVLSFIGRITLRLARQSPALAVDFLCKLNLASVPDAAHEIFMWLANEDVIPSRDISEEQWRHFVQGLAALEDLDDHWIRHFLKKALQVVPDDVMESLKSSLLHSCEKAGWARSGLSEDRDREGLGLMSIPQGTRLVRELLNWTLEQDKPESYFHAVGRTLAALCGKYDKAFLEELLSWMSGGSDAHADMVAGVLRSAHNTIIFEHSQFVRDLLDAADVIGDNAVAELSSALYAATTGGGRSTTPGEPFDEDLKIEEHANEVLSTLSKIDPSYRLYADLLASANEGIARQRRQKEALDAEDDE